MKASKPCNHSLLKAIAEAKEISREELKEKHLPPEDPRIIHASRAVFDHDLNILKSEGHISINGDVICFIRW